MRYRRLILATVVAGAAAASGAGAAVQAAPAGSCLAHITKAGTNWQAIQPHFDHGSQKVTDVLVTAYSPDRMYATNGSELLLTQDAGCHWVGIVIPAGGGSLSALPPPANGLLKIPSTTRITALTAPSSGTVSDRVYIGLEDTSSVAGLQLSQQIRVGYYNGNTWNYDSSGLPQSGHISALAASGTTPNIAYAVVDPTPAEDAQGQGGVYSTNDGGATWTQGDAAMRSSDLRDLKVDPSVPNLIYALGSNGIVISNDGGKNWSHSTKPGSDIDSYDIASGSGSVQIVQGHSGASRYDHSRDAGQTWQSLPGFVTAKQVAIQPLVNNVAVSDGKLLWIMQPANYGSGARLCHRGSTPGSMTCKLGHNKIYARLATPTIGSPNDLQFTAATGAGYALIGLVDGQILRGVFHLDGTADLNVSLIPVQLLQQVLPHHFPSTLTPGKSVVTLPPGAHQDVNYHLLLPRTPSPIDVMFLVDTSSSTEQTIQGLKQDLADIINQLSTAGLDVEFGLADFRDYSPLWGYGNGELHDYPYRLDQRISRVTAGLRIALNKLRASGGGDPPESQLTAVYQSTTGAGQHYGKHVLVPAGEDAGYRPQAMKLAVLATDERFHHESYYLTPSWARTISALRSHGVHPIGLALQTVNDDNKQTEGFHSFADEQKLARLAGSFAPRGGVDCNGDLVAEPYAHEGAPFVCQVPVKTEKQFSVKSHKFVNKVLPVKLAPAITTAAESIPDLRSVGLAVHSPAGGAAIARVIKGASQQVNLKADNALDFTVRYTCPKLKTQHVYPEKLDATDGVRVFASTGTQVACGAVPPPPVHHVIPQQAIALAAPAAAAAPPPAPPSNPVPNPNPNPNPNPALNANVGFASQEEEQRQLAFATENSFEDDTSNELAMSRLGMGAGLLMMAAFGYAARRRVSAAWHQNRR